MEKVGDSPGHVLPSSAPRNVATSVVPCAFLFLFLAGLPRFLTRASGLHCLVPPFSSCRQRDIRNHCCLLYFWRSEFHQFHAVPSQAGCGKSSLENWLQQWNKPGDVLFIAWVTHGFTWKEMIPDCFSPTSLLTSLKSARNKEIKIKWSALCFPPEHLEGSGFWR